MKKVLLLAVMICLVCTLNALAATSQQISVTVTITQSVSVSVSPATYAYGATGEGTTVATAVDAFTAVNDGNGAENLMISVGNSNNWTAGTTTAEDVFVLNYYNGSAWSLVTPATGAALSAGLAPAGSVSFGLQLSVPTSTGRGGVEQSIPVTVTASAS